MSSQEALRILGIPGSLRRASFNLGLLRAAQEVAPPDARIELHPLHAVPLYDEDLEAQGDPEGVRALKAAIAAADAVLIATPEYNYSVPGVLKNALDWVSRPQWQTSPLREKPVALMGASLGGFGTTRAQHHLRQVFVALDAPVLAQPQVQVPFAGRSFDAAGNLTDDAAREQVRLLVVALAAWTRRLRGEAASA